MIYVRPTEILSHKLTDSGQHSHKLTTKEEAIQVVPNMAASLQIHKVTYVKGLKQGCIRIYVCVSINIYSTSL